MSLLEFLQEQNKPQTESEETTENVEENTEVTDDSKDTEGLGGEEREGEKPIETVQEQEGSGEEVEGDRILQTQEEKVEPVKKKIDILSFIEENKEAFKTYLLEKDTDYSSLSDVEAVKIKLKKDNPELDDKDISLILEDKYSYGIDPIEIDEDSMTPEEIRDYKRVNRAIEIGKAKLKTEGKQAKSFLNSNKEALSVPEFEVDEIPQQTIDEEKIFTEKYKQLVSQEEDRVNKQVIPKIKDGLKSVSEINVDFSYEDNSGKVALPIKYKLTDEDKGILVNSLAYRQDKDGDQKYIKSDGSVDFQKLLDDEGKYYLNEKLTKIAIKEAVMNERKKFVKEKLVNYEETPKNLSNDSADYKHPSLALLDILK